jgi:hypothetical protein
MASISARIARSSAPNTTRNAYRTRPTSPATTLADWRRAGVLPKIEIGAIIKST